MGTDIHAFIEVFEDEKWEWLKIDGPAGELWKPFDRDYSLFGFLAGVRCRDIPQIHPCRGLPADISPALREEMGPTMEESVEEYGHGWLHYWNDWYCHSWATGAELLSFDYGREFEAPEGHPVKVGDVLGRYVTRFEEIAALGPAGPKTVRVVYAFDS